ncbi:MAG: VWA domain-containing protein [Blastocatellia bacterium]|nr:VWA domain-containing protein [Blastocatellia bacterium]
MKPFTPVRMTAISILLASLLVGSLIPNPVVSAQSGRQPTKKSVEKKTDAQKGAQKPGNPAQDPDEIPIPRDLQDQPPLKLSTQVVNVDVTVVDKKTRRLLTDLKKESFTIYEDGVKQEVTNFASGEGPMTVVLLIDNGFQNRYLQSWTTPALAQEIFQSAAAFVQGFVKPEDFVALVTFSMRIKVIQDFTGDRNKLYGALVAASRDTLNFSESNIYDALAFALTGGKAIQLFEEEGGPSEYVGLEEIEGHTAVILITSGIDTFSRITYDKALKTVSGAGVPIFTVGVGNLFFKKYEHQMSGPQRLTYLMAFNQLKSFAERSGGEYFPMTFEGEIPQIMRNIEVLLRNQYSVGYVPSNTRREGKERKIKVEIDINGDGKPDTKQLEVNNRQRYIEPDDTPDSKD